MAGPAITWGTSGVVDLGEDDDVLRFHVVDPNQVIKHTAAGADLFGEVLEHLGFPRHWQALTLSAYAPQDDATRHGLVTSWRYRPYLIAPVGRLRAKDVPLWPTAVRVDDEPDPYNHVHFDVVAAYGPDLLPAGLDGSKQQRAQAREALWPMIERVLGLFSGPFEP